MSLVEIWNLRGVCWHIDWWWQLAVRRYSGLAVPYSSAILFKTKSFSQFFVQLMESSWNLKHFRKKMIVIANVFPKLQTVKDLVKQLSRKHSFRTSFKNQRVNGCQTLVKSALEHFYHIFWSLWGEMIPKIFPLFKFEILGGFVNTLTADDKYPVRDCENLQFPIQMQLS